MQNKKEAGDQGMSETIVSMRGICKSFPGVKALDHVDFELRSGEVMALLGENGAGKSTLMKVLSGVYQRDEGTLEIFGKQYGDLNPRLAQEVGVAIIHQELNMCKHLSVVENMFLGREKRRGIRLDNASMEAEAKGILDELKIDLDPRQVVGELPVSKQQMVEIAKALSTNARILIMDEPTSALTAREIDDLFRIIRELKAKGCGIVYISHRLEELQHIVDRVTIMRDGQYITSMDFQGVTLDEIIAYMVGRAHRDHPGHLRGGSQGGRADPPGRPRGDHQKPQGRHPGGHRPGPGGPEEGRPVHQAVHPPQHRPAQSGFSVQQVWRGHAGQRGRDLRQDGTGPED